jgi:hypothetical protein
MHRQYSIEQVCSNKTGKNPTAAHRAGTFAIALGLLLSSGFAAAAPLALLDRNGSYVSI